MGSAIDNNTALPSDVKSLQREQRILLAESHLADDPDVQLVHEVDATYNCLGLVFASRRAVILPDQVVRILGEDQYVEVSDETAMPGDIVTWSLDGSFEHAGIVIRMNEFYGIRLPVVLSKWGFYGEFTHPARTLPHVYGDPVQYWRVVR